MKYTILLHFTLFLVLIFSKSTFGQKVNWSNSFKTGIDSKYAMLGKSNDMIYLLEKGKKDYLYQFDNNQKLLQKVEFFIADKKGVSHTLKDCFLLGDQIIIFSTSYSKDKQLLLSRHIYDANTLQKSKPREIIATGTLRTNNQILLTNKKGIFLIKKNEDKLTYFVQTEQLSDDKNIQLETSIYNQRHEKLFSSNSPYDVKEFSINTNTKIKILKSILDTNNDVFQLCFKTDKIIHKSEMEMGRYFLRKQSKESSQEFVTLLEIPNKSITNITINETKETIICAGFLGSPTTKSQTKRLAQKETFTLIVDKKSGKVLSTNLYSMDDEFIYDKIKVREYLSEQYYVDRILVKSDLSFQLIAENRYYTIDPMSVASGSFTPITYPNRNEIIIIDFNQSGEFNWIKKINKKQVSNLSAPIGYLTGMINDKTYFLLNDCKLNNGNIDNYSFPCLDVFVYGGLMMIEVDKQGSSNRKVMTEYSNFFIPFSPALSKLSGSDFLLFGNAKKKTVLGQIDNNIPTN